MMMESNLSNSLKCLFGFHNYTIQSQKLPYLAMICCLCHQYAYKKFPSGYEEWYEFSNNDWLRYQYKLPDSGVVMKLSLDTEQERMWHRVT